MRAEEPFPPWFALQMGSAALGCNPSEEKPNINRGVRPNS